MVERSVSSVQKCQSLPAKKLQTPQRDDGQHGDGNASECADVLREGERPAATQLMREPQRPTHGNGEQQGAEVADIGNIDAVLCQLR